MDRIIDKPSNKFQPESNSIEYTSKILQLLADSFEIHSNSLVLDVGPVCTENIEFFAQRVKKLYVCDLFARQDLERRNGLKPNCVWRHLDYAQHSFDAINLWDLVEHLDDNEAKGLTENCCNILKPNGLLFLTSFERQPPSDKVCSFVSGPDFRISLRPQLSLHLPWYHRHNRALISLFSSFTIIKIFRYRSGIREFLFQNC